MTGLPSILALPDIITEVQQKACKETAAKAAVKINLK
jgi:hypothetical protein